MSAVTDFDTVDVLSVVESHEFFERRSLDSLGLDRLGFLTALGRGDFVGQEDKQPVADLIALLPFALAE